MPTFNVKSHKLQCPFCSMVSTRGTGLSSHVRARHPREYGKWNKNPNRLLEAAAPPQPESKRNRRLHPVRSPVPVKPGEAATPMQPLREKPKGLAAPAAPAAQTGDNDAREAVN